jgi:hypothetical protein
MQMTCNNPRHPWYEAGKSYPEEWRDYRAFVSDMGVPDKSDMPLLCYTAAYSKEDAYWGYEDEL